MREEIIVAVVDTGLDYGKLRGSARDKLYRNRDEVPGNGRDDDGNGLVDDVTGPSTGPASNGYYQPREGSGHGLAMVNNVARQLDAAEAATGEAPDVSIMPVSMTVGGYYSNIRAAAEAGASIVSLSHNLDYSQKAFVSRMLEGYDAIAVTVGRDRPGNVNPDAGEGAGRAFDNVIEVALISDAVVKGNVHVDLLEVGSSLNNRSESHAIANAAGKIAAVWGADPSRGAVEVLDIVEAATNRDHPTIRSQGLRAEMGGQIDLGRAMALADGGRDRAPAPTPEPRKPAPGPAPEKTPATVELNVVEAKGGYVKGTAGGDAVRMGEKRVIAFGGGGDDVFVLTERPEREHVLRDFDGGDVLDLSALTAPFAEPEDHVRLRHVAWNGLTHTRVEAELDDGRWTRLALIQGVDDVTMDDFIL